jgi:Zn-dependent alcohol dehydrogenase
VDGRITIDAPFTHAMPLAASDEALELLQAGEPIRSAARH